MGSENKYYGKSLMSRDTLDSITKNQREICTDPFFSENLHNKVMKALFQESNVNSARLETELNRKILLGNNSENCKRERVDKNLKKAAREIGRRVHEAWQSNYETFEGNVSEELILSMGELIEPYSNRGARLRDISAQIKGVGFAIDAAKLRSMPGREGDLERFLREVNGEFVFEQRKSEENSYDITSAERAAYAHLMVFYLQPNKDGNKRTGRLLQNLILYHSDIPAPVIYGPENERYMELLCSAFVARRRREGNPVPGEMISLEEHRFYEFIGKKILVSQTNIMDKLAKERKYSVEILRPKKHNEPLYISAANALNSLMKKRDPEGFVKCQKKQKIIVKGDITEEDISAVLDSIHKLDDYSIEPYTN